MKIRKPEVWTAITWIFLGLFVLFLIYPLFGILRQSVFNAEGQFSLEQFDKFFSTPYYSQTILNSFKVTIAVTAVTLLLGIPFAYFYSFYQLKGSKFLITSFIKDIFGIQIQSIYGFGGILMVQALKFFPLVFVYMNGAFKSIDNTLLEASANMGCTGVKRFFTVVMQLSMPTILAASLLVFMRAFADFGTPLLIGEGYRTFPVEIYNQYLGENGTDHNFAAAISVIAILVTAVVFFIQKWATKKYNFSISALHPVQKRKPKGLGGVLMYLYCYGLIALAFLPQIYIVYLSFRNCEGAVFKPGFSLINYEKAMKKLLVRSIENTVIFGVVSLAIIILLAILIAYLVVRRPRPLNHAIDTMSMLPYIMPGSIIGIALVIAFGRQPFALTGTMAIMIIALVIRRMPYTIRSATATLQSIPLSTEEASISLGAGKIKTFLTVTTPMMANGIMSGAVLSWVAIVTELSSAIILYNNKTITLTMSTYAAISRGNDGLACAFAAILTVLTALSLILYLAVTKSEDIKL